MDGLKDALARSGSVRYARYHHAVHVFTDVACDRISQEERFVLVLPNHVGALFDVDRLFVLTVSLQPRNALALVEETMVNLTTRGDVMVHYPTCLRETHRAVGSTDPVATIGYRASLRARATGAQTCPRAPPILKMTVPLDAEKIPDLRDQVVPLIGRIRGRWEANSRRRKTLEAGSVVREVVGTWVHLGSQLAMILTGENLSR